MLVELASAGHRAADYQAAAMRASADWTMRREGANCAADQDAGSLKPGCCDLCACKCGKRLCLCFFTDKKELLACTQAPSLFMAGQSLVLCFQCVYCRSLVEKIGISVFVSLCG